MKNKLFYIAVLVAGIVFAGLLLGIRYFFGDGVAPTGITFLFLAIVIGIVSAETWFLYKKFKPKKYYLVYAVSTVAAFVFVFYMSIFSDSMDLFSGYTDLATKLVFSSVSAAAIGTFEVLFQLLNKGE